MNMLTLFHQNYNIKTKVVDIDDIYDEYSLWIF